MQQHTTPDFHSASTALEASRQACAVAARLHSIIGFNNGPDQYIQVHDAASAPADGAVPRWTKQVGAGSDFYFDVMPGAIFTKGIYVCNSTTAVTKTLGSANCLFDVNARARVL